MLFRSACPGRSGAPPGRYNDLPARSWLIRTGKLVLESVARNKAGAGGNLAHDTVAHAPSDGYTMLFSPGSLPIMPLLFSSLSYDPIADLAPVSLIGNYPNLVVVSPGSPIKTLKDYLDAAKANPGKVTFATPGIGTTPHFAAELLKKMANVDITHVPYRGGAPAMTDLIAGRIDYWCPFSTTAMPQIAGNTVKPIAIFALQRLAVLPELRTAHEQGLANFEASTWNALFAPKGTPPTIVQKLHEATVQAVATPSSAERLRELGMSPAAPDRRSPEFLAKFVRDEIVKWEGPIKASGLSVE